MSQKRKFSDALEKGSAKSLKKNARRKVAVHSKKRSPRLATMLPCFDALYRALERVDASGIVLSNKELLLRRNVTTDALSVNLFLGMEKLWTPYPSYSERHETSALWPTQQDSIAQLVALMGSDNPFAAATTPNHRRALFCRSFIAAITSRFNFQFDVAEISNAFDVYYLSAMKRCWNHGAPGLLHQPDGSFWERLRRRHGKEMNPLYFFCNVLADCSFSADLLFLMLNTVVAANAQQSRAIRALFLMAVLCHWRGAVHGYKMSICDVVSEVVFDRRTIAVNRLSAMLKAIQVGGGSKRVQAIGKRLSSTGIIGLREHIASYFVVGLHCSYDVMNDYQTPICTSDESDSDMF
jgi:hypothetical protein